MGCHPLLQGIFLTQGLNLVSHIAGRFFIWGSLRFLISDYLSEPLGKPKILERVTIFSSRGSSQSRDPTCVSCNSLPLSYFECAKVTAQIENHYTKKIMTKTRVKRLEKNTWVSYIRKKEVCLELSIVALIELHVFVYFLKSLYFVFIEQFKKYRLGAWDKCSGLVHWDDPEGWDGEGGGRGVQDGEHM